MLGPRPGAERLRGRWFAWQDRPVGAPRAAGSAPGVGAGDWRAPMGLSRLREGDGMRRRVYEIEITQKFNREDVPEVRSTALAWARDARDHEEHCSSAG